jgi:hypothetical protein
LLLKKKKYEFSLPSAFENSGEKGKARGEELAQLKLKCKGDPEMAQEQEKKPNPAAAHEPSHIQAQVQS